MRGGWPWICSYVARRARRRNPARQREHRIRLRQSAAAVHRYRAPSDRRHRGASPMAVARIRSHGAASPVRTVRRRPRSPPPRSAPAADCTARSPPGAPPGWPRRPRLGGASSRLERPTYHFFCRPRWSVATLPLADRHRRGHRGANQEPARNRETPVPLTIHRRLCRTSMAAPPPCRHRLACLHHRPAGRPCSRAGGRPVA